MPESPPVVQRRDLERVAVSCDASKHKPVRYASPSQPLQRAQTIASLGMRGVACTTRWAQQGGERHMHHSGTVF